MWYAKVQVFSENFSMHVALRASMVGSGIVSVKPYCVLEETWVTQSRDHCVEKSQELSSWKLMSLKSTIVVSFFLSTMACG